MSNLCIYQPKGKAGEYAAWACNLYTGCSNDCSYCYCKKGPLGSWWTLEPHLKKCFRDEEHAYAVFIKELEQNVEALRRDGLFFSFTTDPLLPKERILTTRCVEAAVSENVPVSILTKMPGLTPDQLAGDSKDHLANCKQERRNQILQHVAWGFTLTGCNNLEPGAATNGQRIAAMEKLHDMGFRTFASLEPVIDPARTLACYDELVRRNCCDLVKVGLESGRKEPYFEDELKDLHKHIASGPIPYYFKNSYADLLGMPRQKPVDIFTVKPLKP